MAKTVITLSKTVQVANYEPITMTLVKEFDKVLNEEDMERQTRKLGRSLHVAMDKEVSRWRDK